MSVCLLVMTDGRDDVLAETMASLAADLHGPITRRVLYDDTGFPAHAHALRRTYPAFEVLQHPNGRQGFGGAIRAAWAHVGCFSERYVFHAEDDFTLNRSLDLTPLMAVLDACPHLAQLVLKRQPWNPDEEAAGGIIEQHPDDYTERTFEVGAVTAVLPDANLPDYARSAVWTEHRRYFSTNPSLYRRSLTFRGWPDVEHSEGHFSIDLFADPDVRCAFWGGKADPPMVHHIGKERAGCGY